MVHSNIPVYQPGEIVQLKSGGPFLTVAFAQGEEVGLLYWNEKNEIGSFTTHPLCLRYANTPPTSPDDARILRGTTVAKSSMS